MGYFLFQTFDALDGKQARKLKTGSSFGEMFDSACDVIAIGKNLRCILSQLAEFNQLSFIFIEFSISSYRLLRCLETRRQSMAHAGRLHWRNDNGLLLLLARICERHL